MTGQPMPRLRGVHRALADPLRIRLFELLAVQPSSARELAALIGRQPNRLYHHLAQLESGGLIEVTEYRRAPGGKAERVYAPTSVEPPADAASSEEQLQFLAAVLEVTRADITAARQAGEAGEHRNVALIRSVVRLSEQRVDALRTHIKEFVRAADEQPDDDGAWTTILFAAIDRQDRAAGSSRSSGSST